MVRPELAEHERARAGWNILLPLLPLLLAILVHGRAVPDAGWVLDDGVNLAVHANHGHLLGEWTHPTYAWAGAGSGHIWRPIPATLQHLVALAFGRASWVFRATNLALLLVLLMAIHRAARRWGASRAVAAFGAAVVALHPVTPDVVAWSSDIYDIVAAIGVVGVLTACGAARPSAVGVGVLTLAALLGKESVMPLPAIVAVVVFFRSGLRAAVAPTVGSALGVLLWVGLHQGVTGQSYGDAGGESNTLEKVIALCHVVGGMFWLPTDAPMLHLFDPGELQRTLSGIVGITMGGVLVAVAPERKTLIAAALAAGGLAIPGAVGIPLSGVDPVRYSFLPVVALVVLGAGALSRIPRPAVVAAAVAVLVLGPLPRTLARPSELRDTGTLATAELALEPDNAYAKTLLGRARFAVGDRSSLRIWQDGLDTVPARVRLVDQRMQRWDLAKACFLAGEPAAAWSQIEHLRRLGAPYPDQFHCLTADVLDRLGRAEEAAVAARACRP